MHFIFVRRAACLVGVALACSLATAPAQGQTKDTPAGAAAVRKALDQKITLDFSSQNLDEAIDHLRQKAKLNIAVDTFAVQMMGVGINGVPGMPAGPITLKSDNGKVRTALQNMLNQFHLTYVILGDTVVITTEDFGYLRQMRQRVNIDVQGLPLRKALQQLSDETGTNLVIDPRQSDKADQKVNLQLDDVTLETAVRLLTELADLASVRVGTVVFITSEARADKLRKENNQNNNRSNPYGLYPPPFAGGALPPIGGRIGGFGGQGKMLPPQPPPVQAVPLPAIELPPLPERKKG